MANKKDFDFNQLYRLYQEWEIEFARIMLYWNIDVFLKHSWFNIIEWYNDIVQDVVLEIDKRMQSSIAKWFHTKQVYRFVRMRLSWWFKNRHNRKDKMWYWDFDEEVAVYDTNDLDAEAIKAYICNMEDPIRIILLLKHYSNFSLDKISRHIWSNVAQTTKMYNEWIASLQLIFNNENTNPSES